VPTRRCLRTGAPADEGITRLTIHLTIPIPNLTIPNLTIPNLAIVLAVLAVLAGVVAALLPARRVARLHLLDAIATN
jgi:ABC-type antimicrobial peptide transport system permease subunit